jgi:hypothetical protein
MKSHRLALVLVAGAAGMAVLALSIGSAASAATNGGCLLKGTASFTPGLGLTASAQSYTFSGTLSNCEGVAGITSGSIAAAGNGSLSCGSGSSSGSATVTWNDGTQSVISFTTTSAAAATEVVGSITSGTFAGSNTKAAIVFSTTTPQDCAMGGLTSASFQGPAEIGT